MIITSCLIGITCTLFLNIVFVRRITNKMFRICITAANILFALFFIALISTVIFIDRHLETFIDTEIQKLENNMHEIYPDILKKKFTTVEIKRILESSTKTESGVGLNKIASDIVKSKIEVYTSSLLEGIKAIEDTDDMLSVKDVIISVKNLSLQTVKPYIKTAKNTLIILYLIYFILSMIASWYFKDKKENKTIIFGNDADCTILGMKTED